MRNLDELMDELLEDEEEAKKDRKDFYVTITKFIILVAIVTVFAIGILSWLFYFFDLTLDNIFIAILLGAFISYIVIGVLRRD